MNAFYAGILLVAAILAPAGAPAFGQIQVAKVTGGDIKGTVENDLGVFKGIPFAAAPVGDLRWKAPQPVTPWAGVKETTAFAPASMQSGSVKMSEDCLYLNVWTPAKDAAEHLPVMVWLHGGSFTGGRTGDPAFDGAKLAHKGVLVVSVAYRVGPLGFLAHPELSKESGEGSGCYGLMDQIAGLRWVHDNVAQLGGDPGKVTVFGESAGGVSISLLTVSPPAKGLFRAAISQSGGCMSPNRITNEYGDVVPTLALAEKTGEDLFTQVGAHDLKEARALSAAAILRGSVRIFPVADGATIPGDAYGLFQAGKFNDVNILVGTNSDEGGSFVRAGEFTAANFEQIVRGRYGAAADELLKVYPHATDAQAAASGRDLFRDGGFAWHTWAWAQLQSRKGRGKAFVYYFDLRGVNGADGARHGADVPYVFGNRKFASPAETDLSALMMNYWTNFAKTGDPNGAGLPKWPAYKDEAPQAMLLGAAPGAGPYPNLDKLRAFDGYYAWRRTEFARQAASR